MVKAFCPNCGTENEGMAGGRVTCRACTASFEVPRDASWVAPQPTQAPPPTSVRDQPMPGYIGPPPSGFLRGGGGGNSGGYNTLSIVSLVLGVLCCLPFGSVGAIATGVIAMQQIEQRGERGRELAIAGIVLGGLSIVGTILMLITQRF